MIVTPIKTEKITSDHKDLFEILDKSLPEMKENSVLAVTSKIVAICEGRVTKMEDVNKDALIEQESQYYLERKDNPYNVSLTITRNNLVATAGIDESNGNGFYILWPSDPQKSANQIRAYLKEKFKLKNVGVIITDSRTTPLRWGVTSFSLGFSGIKALIDYSGKPDLFGRLFKFEKLNVVDSLATAAALVMGEGDEQTPLSLIEDIPSVEFQDEDPNEKDLEELTINIQEDLYTPLLKSAPWIKGGKT